MMSPENGGKWGLMGGIFDPVHIGHLVLAESALEKCRLDGVLFVVSLNPPHRAQKPIASFEDRLMMTRLAIAENERFVISDLEKKLASPGYTLAVVEYLEQQYPSAEWTMILGADNIAIFDSWHKPEELVKRIRIVVGHRPGYDVTFEKSVWKKHFTTFDMPLLQISSTAIRQSIRQGSSVRYFVPDEVREFIISRGLYK
jgi:nicotinate-nucleotide adenylyltransferase